MTTFTRINENKSNLDTIGEVYINRKVHLLTYNLPTTKSIKRAINSIDWPNNWGLFFVWLVQHMGISWIQEVGRRD